MKSEEYKKKIMEDTGLTRSEIQGLVDEKKDELKGLISEEGALFIIAKELGVEVKETTKEPIIYLVDVLNQKLKNLNVIGRIKNIYDSHIFARKDGTQGKVLNFRIWDKTESVRVTVWDDMVDKLLENPEFMVNELIEIRNAYTKWSDYNNEYEINLGKYSKILLKPKVDNEDEYPETETYDEW